MAPPLPAAPPRPAPPAPPRLSAAPSTAAAPVSAPATYLSRLKAWIARHQNYPAQARWRRLQGTALVHFSLDRNGRLVEIRIEKSSGHASLDREALDLLRRAQPMPRPPISQNDDPLDITLPIVFRLL